MFKGFSTQEYLDEFSRRDLAGWTAFQAEVLAVGETADGLMAVKRWMGTLAAYSGQMRALTEKWYKDSMKSRNDWAARNFKFQGEKDSDKNKKNGLTSFQQSSYVFRGHIKISGVVF